MLRHKKTSLISEFNELARNKDVLLFTLVAYSLSRIQNLNIVF